MAVTVSNPVSASVTDVWGRHHVALLKVTMDSSYASDGEPFDPNGFLAGMGPVLFVGISLEGAAAKGFVATFDYANKKIVMHRQKDPADTGGADIALPEVGSGVDLSTIAMRVLVVYEA